MNCWHCNTKLIWGGDHDCADDAFLMETNLNCPKCHSLVFVLWGEDGKEDEKEAEKEDEKG